MWSTSDTSLPALWPHFLPSGPHPDIPAGRERGEGEGRRRGGEEGGRGREEEEERESGKEVICDLTANIL